MYNRFSSNPNSKHGSDHSIISSPQASNAVPIWEILKLPEKIDTNAKGRRYYEKWSQFEIRDDKLFYKILPFYINMLSNFDIEEIANHYNVDVVIVMKGDCEKATRLRI